MATTVIEFYRKIDKVKLALLVVTTILICIVVFQCKGSTQTVQATQHLKGKLIENSKQLDKYAVRINKLNDSLVIIKALKSKSITKTILIKEATKKQETLVATYSVKEKAQYYQKRYSLPVVITQYGIALSDSASTKNIIDLTQRDGYYKELIQVNKTLIESNRENVTKDTIIAEFNKSLIVYKSNDSINKVLVLNAENNTKKERTAKNVSRFVAGAAFIALLKVVLIP